MKCKDIDTISILRFIYDYESDNPMYSGCTIFEGFDNSVINAMPEGTPEKIVLAKMKKLLK